MHNKSEVRVATKIYIRQPNTRINYMPLKAFGIDKKHLISIISLWETFTNL